MIAIKWQVYYHLLISMTQSYSHISILLLLSLAFLCSLTNSLSATPYFEINNKYIQTGSYTVSTTSIYTNTSLDTYSVHFFANPLGRAHTPYYAISTFTRLNYQLSALSQMNITNLVYSWSSSQLNSALQGKKLSGLFALGIRYLVLDAPYLNKATDIFTGLFYIQNYTTKPFSNLALQNPTFGSFVTNLTGGTKAFAFFNGLNATATSNNQFDINLQAFYPVAGAFRISVSSAIPTPINLGGLQMTLIGFNVLAASTWPFPAMRTDQGIFSPSSPYLDTNNTFQTYNTFYGVTGFGFSGQSTFDFSSTFTPNTSISASSAVPFTHLQWMGVVFWVKECKAPTIYYMISNDTCYDICPNYYFQNSTSYLCQLCTAYDCLKCNTTQLCTLCDNVTAFRVLNTTTGRCDPMPGYYQTATGVVICPPCNSNCKTCITTSTYCLSCYPSFYLSGNVCQPCSASCNNCTSAINCTNCTSPYDIDINTFSCIINCSSVVGNCTNCTSIIPIACTQCVLGYFLSTATNTCSVSCGDGVLASTQICDDGNLNDGDGCSSLCVIQQSHYCNGKLGDHSLCYNCSNNCLNCSSVTFCTLCDSLTILEIPTTSCIPNCQIITNCTACHISSATVVCDSCILGYAVNASNMCATFCGDGIILGSEVCDDNNSVDGDGCSSVCAIETAFYCTGAPSTCLPCSIYCSTCSSATNCSLCNTLAILETSNTSCSANCTLVPSCLTCSILNVNSASQYLQCTNCTTGYSLEYGANICNTICGDGLILGNQACDDGNLLNGDGCSSVCAIEPAFYCSGAPSVCGGCLQYCYVCPTASDCSQCNAITVWDPAKSICFANCSVIDYCLTCTVSSSIGGDYIQCLSCSGGYSVDSSSNKCMPICGDGIVAPEQQCDDGNKNSGDGCSSYCQVQTYFTCTTTPPNISSCQLSQLSFILSHIIKNEGSNSGVIHLQPTPSALSIYKDMDWSSIITTTNSNINITSVSYDPDKDQIVVNFDYSATIQDSQLQLQINTKAHPKLSSVTPFKTSVKAQASDNEAFVNYSDTDYTLGKVAGYVSLGIGAITFVFLIAGAFGGRLIGLQCAAVIQMAYLSILTLQNLSPGFKSLQMLYLCFGYNKLRSYDYSQPIDRPFKAAQFDKLLIYNYNVMGLLVFAPLVGALVCKLVAHKKQKEQNVWGSYTKYCVGQYMLYILLSFCYLANLSLYIQLKFMESSIIDYLGIGIGVLVLAALTFYLIFYAQADSFFTQFKDKFNKDSFSRRFYIFPIVQRVISPAILTLAVAKGYGNAPIIGINALLAVLILIKSPYKGDKKNIRPFTNYVITMIIQGIYLGVSFSKNPQGILSLYGPLIVLVLLLVSVAYSAYALAKQLKEKIQSCGKNTNEHSELQMKEFTAKFFKEDNSLFINRNLIPNQLDLTAQLSKRSVTSSKSPDKQAESAQQSNLAKIRTQLNLMKKNTVTEGVVEMTGYNQSFKEIMDHLEDEI